jgi:hypothetical protein
MLDRIVDVIIAFLIVVSIIFVINIKDKKDTKCEKEEVSDNDLTELAKHNNIYWDNISANPCVVELLKKRFEYEKRLSDAEYKKLPSRCKINWVELSRNHGAIELIRERIEYENSLGPNYEYQYDNTFHKLNKINWFNMSANKNAIDLLRDRITYEKSLNIEEYGKLKDKIDWNEAYYRLNKNTVILMKDYYLSDKFVYH